MSALSSNGVLPVHPAGSMACSLPTSLLAPCQPVPGSMVLMQPYFFPYIGYFSMVAACERFIFFDTVQFTRKTWMSRNRLLAPGRKSDQIFSVGVDKAPLGTALAQIVMKQDGLWQQKMVSQLQQYKRFAPFYNQTMAFVHEMLQSTAGMTGLCDFNIYTTRAICQYLGINPLFENLSEVSFDYEPANRPDRWGLQVGLGCGARVFINAPGGESWISADPFTDHGISLGFIQPQLVPYNQKNEGQFIPGLSILDVLLWNGQSFTSHLVQQFSIRWKNAAPGAEKSL